MELQSNHTYVNSAKYKIRGAMAKSLIYLSECSWIGISPLAQIQLKVTTGLDKQKFAA